MFFRGVATDPSLGHYKLERECITNIIVTKAFAIIAMMEIIFIALFFFSFLLSFIIAFTAKPNPITGNTTGTAVNRLNAPKIKDIIAPIT